MNKIKKKNGFINGIRKNGPGDYTARARVRVPNGKTVERRADAETAEEAKRKKEELKAQIRSENKMELGNQVSTVRCKCFKDLAQYYKSHHQDTVTNPYLEILIRDLGHVPTSQVYNHFLEYNELLRVEVSPRTGKVRSNKTINHYVVTMSTVFNYCSLRQSQPFTGVKDNPFADFIKLPTKGRNRVFRNDERKRLIKLMEEKESKLLPALLFSERNPIRQGDLVSLTRENIYYYDSKMVIKYYASKTRKIIDKPTCLMWIPDEVKEYWENLPETCPWLFPVIKGDTIRQMNSFDFNRHWHKLLREVKIEDFHWHDLKHVAITYLRDIEKVTKEEIKDLGIQFSEKMIDLYYHDDAEKAITRYFENNVKKAA